MSVDYFEKLNKLRSEPIITDEIQDTIFRSVLAQFVCDAGISRDSIVCEDCEVLLSDDDLEIADVNYPQCQLCLWHDVMENKNESNSIS